MKDVETTPRRGLSKDDFQFKFFGLGHRLFPFDVRKLTAISNDPSYQVLKNVVYTPARSMSGRKQGALYDASLRIVPHSELRRGLDHSSVNFDPAHLLPNSFSAKKQDGLYLYLGTLMPHYGHFITETLAKWWALEKDFGNIDGFVVHVHHPEVLEWLYVREFLASLGIDRSKLIFSCERHLCFSEIVVPESSLQLESHGYSAYRRTCNLIAANLGAHRHERSSQPLYVSRTALAKGVYRYEGEEEIERFFLRRGANVIHPESMSIAEQFKAFSTHNRIFGIIGSGMHNIAFSRDPGRIVYFTPSWVNSTCLLIDHLSGASSTYVRATTWIDPFASLAGRVLKHTKLMKSVRKGRFHHHRQLDHVRIVDWLVSSGQLD
jgi:hypothetical protein